MIVKTILVKKHSFGSFEVDSIGPVSETANDIRDYRIIKGNSLLAGFVTPSSGEVCGDGPFSGMRRWVQNFTLTSGTNSSVLKFDANLANTLYSDSVTTVRPEAFRALALVRAY